MTEMNPIAEIVVPRSKQKFRFGMRTKLSALKPEMKKVIEPLLTRFKIPKDKPFLYSSYLGGSVLTIATKKNCYFVEATELSGEDQRAVEAAHEANQRYFVTSF